MMIRFVLVCLFTLLLLDSCSDSNELLLPGKIPDAIPYSKLGTGKLVFNRYADGHYLIDIDHQRVNEIRIDPVDGCVISPDGEAIAYTSGYMADLHLIHSDGSAFEGYDNNNQHVYQISWAPDSKVLYFLDSSGDSTRINKLTTDPCCSKRQKTRAFLDLDNFYSPFSVSSSGEMAFYAGHNNGELLMHGLYTMDKDGENLTLIQGEDRLFRYEYCTPSWSPAGDQIAYLSLDQNFPAMQWIILIDPDGMSSDTIAEFDVPPNAISEGWGLRNNGLSLCWSPDGSKIAFTKLEGNYVAHIYTIDVNTRELVQVTFKEDAQDYYVSWSMN
jgi:Tol biopolymer transport system component